MTFKDADMNQRFWFFDQVYKKTAPRTAENPSQEAFAFLDETIIEPVEERKPNQVSPAIVR